MFILTSKEFCPSLGCGDKTDRCSLIQPQIQCFGVPLLWFGRTAQGCPSGSHYTIPELGYFGQGEIMQLLLYVKIHLFLPQKCVYFQDNRNKYG